MTCYRLLFLGDNEATSTVGLRHTQRQAHRKRLEFMKQIFHIAI